MKHKTRTRLFFFTLALFAWVSAFAQFPNNPCNVGPTQRTALVNLQKAIVVEGWRAGQIPLTDTCGNQYYQQYVEVNLTPIAYTPTATGNTLNLSEFVIDPGAVLWYIDWQGNAVQFGGGSTCDEDFLQISDNSCPDALTDSIYKYNYVSIGARGVWPTAELLVNDSTLVGMAVISGNRNARLAIHDNANDNFSVIDQGGSTTRHYVQNGGLWQVVTGTGTPQSLSLATEHLGVNTADSTLVFYQYPNTRIDTNTAINFLFTDELGVVRSGNLGAVGAYFYTVTKTQADSLKSSADVIPGAMYRITGTSPVIFGGTDIFLQGLTDTSYSSTGWGIFYTPRYNQAVAGYGIWSEGLAPSPGDTVIWGGYYWVNTTGANSPAISSLELDGTDWDIVPYGSSYQIWYDAIAYDYNNNWIESRENTKGSVAVNQSYSLYQAENTSSGYFPTMSTTQWGNYWEGDYSIPKGISDVHVDASVFDNVNQRGYFQNVVVSNGSLFVGVVVDTGSTLNKVRMDNGYFTDVFLNEASALSNLAIYNGAGFGQDTLQNFTIENCWLSGSSYIQNGGLSSGSMINITLTNNSYFYIISINDAGISYVTMDNRSHIDNMRLETNSFIEVVYLGNSTALSDFTLINSSAMENDYFSGCEIGNWSFDGGDVTNADYENLTLLIPQSLTISYANRQTNAYTKIDFPNIPVKSSPVRVATLDLGNNLFYSTIGDVLAGAPNGIYGGNGSIPSGTDAAAAGEFRILYSTGGPAIDIDDTGDGDRMFLYSGDGTASVFVSDIAVSMSPDEGTTVVSAQQGVITNEITGIVQYGALKVWEDSVKITNINGVGTADISTKGGEIALRTNGSNQAIYIRSGSGTTVNGNLGLSTVGGKLNIATGTNSITGTATLVAGTVTVNTTSVTSSSIILVNCNTPGGTQGFLSAPSASIVNGTSFVINSSSGSDTSTVNYIIIN